MDNESSSEEGKLPPVTPRPRSWGKGHSTEDIALLEKIITGVLRYRMAVPAIFMLETLLPLAVVGSQAMHFLSPVVGGLVGPSDYDRLAKLLERRDVIERMMRNLERALDQEGMQ